MPPIKRNPSFWLLLSAQSVSTFGDIVYTIAVLSYVYDQTESVLGTGGLMILTSLTRLAAGFLTVQVVDRFPHRTLMALADLTRGAAVAVLALLSLQGAMSLPAVYAAFFLNAIAGAFYNPARSAILPSIVAKAELVRANGIIATAVQVVMAASWALGAPLVLAVGTTAAIGMNAVSFLASALAVAFIRPGTAAGAAGPRLSPWGQLAAGWQQLWRNRVVRDVTLMDAIETFANTIWTSPLMLAFTVEALGVGEQWWGYQGAAYFGGTILGGVVAAWAAAWLSRKGGWMIALSGGGFAVLTAWYALNQSPPLAVALCVAFGPVYQVRDVVQSSMLQDAVDPQVIGRAFVAREMLLMTLFSPAMAAMSLLADAAGPRSAYLLGAVLYAAVGLMAALSVPVRTYRIGAAERAG